MAIVANKFQHVYAALCTTTEAAAGARSVNNSNVLCLGGRVTAPDDACRCPCACCRGTEHHVFATSERTRHVPLQDCGRLAGHPDRGRLGAGAAGELLRGAALACCRAATSTDSLTRVCNASPLAQDTIKQSLLDIAALDFAASAPAGGA